MEVRQCKEGIVIAQKKYAMDLLKKFNLNGCKAVETPMNVIEKLQEDDGSGAADHKFRSLVGGLIYLMHTRLDIMFALEEQQQHAAAVLMRKLLLDLAMECGPWPKLAKATLEWRAIRLRRAVRGEAED
ncbi:hypothetical protein NL676_035766 [Syzygium grande]|nr:hypothetical protein NL676_035766 [Syzygium grande]